MKITETDLARAIHAAETRGAQHTLRYLQRGDASRLPAGLDAGEMQSLEKLRDRLSRLDARKKPAKKAKPNLAEAC